MNKLVLLSFFLSHVERNIIDAEQSKSSGKKTKTIDNNRSRDVRRREGEQCLL